MRDAFGGVFMIELFIVFIFIYVAFSAVSLNYAKAFRLKNSIISFVEEKEIIDLSESGMNSKLADLDLILQNANYNKTCDAIGYTEGEIKENDKAVGYCHNGIVIKQISSNQIEGTNSRLIKYEITTAANWNLGILNKLLVLGGRQENSDRGVVGFWKIKGEAEVVLRG